MSKEIKLDVPAIFQRPDLDWLRYAETRRDGSSPLAGNVSEDRGALNQKNYDLVQPDMPLEDWVEVEKRAANGRIMAITSLLGVSKIGRLRPEHNVGFINLDTDIDKITGTVSVADRPFADATSLTEPGLASMIAPADCIVATVVYPSEQVVAQIHAGIRGLPRHIIPQVIQRLDEAGAKPEEALVYISPHAQNGFQMNAQELTEVMAIAQDAGGSVQQETSRFLRPGENDLPKMDLTRFALEQLEQSGISEDRIQVSQADTLTSPLLFSDLKQQEKGVNGRFGVIAGIAKK